MIHITLNSQYSQRGGHWGSGAYLRTSVTIESDLTMLELHITTVPVEHQANNDTFYEKGTQCNEIMVCVC